MEKRKDSTVIIRINAIDLVNECKPVLQDNEFVEAMGNATRLYGDSKGEKSLPEAIFGKEFSGEVTKRLIKKTTERSVLLDNSVPVMMRTFFVDNMDKQQQSWDDFKSSFNQAKEDTK